MYFSSAQVEQSRVLAENQVGLTAVRWRGLRWKALFRDLTKARGVIRGSVLRHGHVRLKIS